MDGVTLVFSKTYYWEVVEINYLQRNESLKLALNSNDLELNDGWHWSDNDMLECYQGINESFDLCLIN